MKKGINLFIVTQILIGSSFIHAQQTVGLFLNDTSAFEGYTLFSPTEASATYLINNDGLLVHKWEHAYKPGHGIYLLENGNLLRSSRK